MKITLVYPPNRNIPGSPYGALPLLAGCLGQEGHEATIVDVNLEVFERLLRRETVDGIRTLFEEHWHALRAKPSLTPEEGRLLQGMAKLAVYPLEGLYEAERAGESLRTLELFRDPANVNHAYETIVNLLRYAYTLNPLSRPLAPGWVDEFYGYVESGADNPISRIVRDDVLDIVLATEPDVVAVTVPFNEQLFETFSFLKQLRERAPHVKTIVGGSIITAYHKDLFEDERTYRYADYGMPGECEQSFPQFATALEQGTDLSAVPNLWWRDEAGAIHEPSRRQLSDLNLSAAPDYSTVPVGRYFLPFTIANYQTSRGCYYGKCTFCSSDIRGNFRFRKHDLVIRDLEQIQQQTGLRHFIFWDPLTSPRIMKAIAQWNLKRPEDERIFWGAETKFEKFFTQKHYTDMLHEGGARFMQFGFESGSQRVLDQMVKGNDLERVHAMMNTLRDSKIAISVQWFIGFPGATEEEDRMSYTYLDDHRSAVVLSSYMGTYGASPDDIIWETSGDIYDIDIVQNADGMLDYVYRDGSSHYDRTDLHESYLARGDAEAITRMAFYIYLTDHPERVREITHWHRAGVLPYGVDEVADSVPERPEWAYVRSYDFDVFTDPVQQGIPAEGGRLAETTCHVGYVTQTGQTYRLADTDLAILDRVDGQRTTAEVLDGVEGDAKELEARFLGLVRRGLLRIPHPASATQPQVPTLSAAG